jgi:hypothetical protein
MAEAPYVKPDIFAYLSPDSDLDKPFIQLLSKPRARPIEAPNWIDLFKGA